MRTVDFMAAHPGPCPFLVALTAGNGALSGGITNQACENRNQIGWPSPSYGTTSFIDGHASNLIEPKLKPLIFAFCVVFAFGRLSAQTNVWQPSPGPYAGADMAGGSA